MTSVIVTIQQVIVKKYRVQALIYDVVAGVYRESRVSGGRKSSSGVQRQSPGGGLGVKPQKL